MLLTSPLWNSRKGAVIRFLNLPNVVRHRRILIIPFGAGGSDGTSSPQVHIYGVSLLVANNITDPVRDPRKSDTAYIEVCYKVSTTGWL